MTPNTRHWSTGHSLCSYLGPPPTHTLSTGYARRRERPDRSTGCLYSTQHARPLAFSYPGLISYCVNRSLSRVGAHPHQTWSTGSLLPHAARPPLPSSATSSRPDHVDSTQDKNRSTGAAAATERPRAPTRRPPLAHPSQPLKSKPYLTTPPHGAQHR